MVWDQNTFSSGYLTSLFQTCMGDGYPLNDNRVKGRTLQQTKKSVTYGKKNV